MKIFSHNLEKLLAESRVENKKIVLATGVFDILHEEHINFLKKAKQEGDVLIIGIESDLRVNKIKGESRPSNDESARKSKLEELNLAKMVVILPEDFGDLETRESFIAFIKPDILAVSSHSEFKIEKQRIVSKYGGELKVVLKHNPEVSTTKILRRE